MTTALHNHQTQNPAWLARGRWRPQLGFQLLAVGAALLLHLLLLSYWPSLQHSANDAATLATPSRPLYVIEVVPGRHKALPAGESELPTTQTLASSKTLTQPLMAQAARPALVQQRAIDSSSPTSTSPPTPAAKSATEPLQNPATAPSPDSAIHSPTRIVPSYSTEPAPAVTLDFALQRGQRQGTATLQWAPQGDRYSLALHTQIEGRPALSWQSQGSRDSSGLAPERYTEGRNGRAARAINFQREEGIVSYSAQTQSFALAPGLQDRSSWLLQLGAILQANRSLSEVGTDIHVWVAGTRGQPELWSFQVQSLAPLTLHSGQTSQALHLLRAASRLYDTEVQVWLDPAQHHLPLRLQMLLHATGEGLQLELRSLRWQ